MPGLEPGLNPPKGLVLAITLHPDKQPQRESNPYLRRERALS